MASDINVNITQMMSCRSLYASSQAYELIFFLVNIVCQTDIICHNIYAVKQLSYAYMRMYATCIHQKKKEKWFLIDD